MYRYSLKIVLSYALQLDVSAGLFTLYNETDLKRSYLLFENNEGSTTKY